MLIFALTRSPKRNRTDDQTISRSFRFHVVPTVVYVTELGLLFQFKTFNHIASLLQDNVVGDCPPRKMTAAVFSNPPKQHVLRLN